MSKSWKSYKYSKLCQWNELFCCCFYSFIFIFFRSFNVLVGGSQPKSLSKYYDFYRDSLFTLNHSYYFCSDSIHLLSSQKLSHIILLLQLLSSSLFSLCPCMCSVLFCSNFTCSHYPFAGNKTTTTKTNNDSNRA